MKTFHNRFFITGTLAFLLLFSTSTIFAAGLDEIDDPAPVPPPAAAQEAPVAPAAAANGAEQAPNKPSNYLIWMVQSCGWFFTPVFLAMSIVMVALFVMNILAIRRDVLHPTLFVEDFTKLLDEKKYQEAYELAKANDSLLAKILAAGLSKVSQGYEKAVQDIVSSPEEIRSVQS